MKSRFISVFCLLLACSSIQSGEPPEKERETISVDDLSKLRIIGKLGIPLGKLGEMRATVVKSGDKDASRYLLQVTMVDGKTLEKPVIMRFRSMLDDIPVTSLELYQSKHEKAATHLTEEILNPLEKDYVGSEVRFSAYESGTFLGIPEGLPESDIWQGHSFQFVPELNVMFKI